MDKAKALQKIAKEIKYCKVCRVGKSGKAVPGEGNANAQVVFVGEAPGRTEAATGRPFVGRSGKFLRKQIADTGLQEKDVYITSPVKYLPGRGTPTAADIVHGKIHLGEQLAVIQPKVLVLLGSVAAQAILGEKILITKEHGTVRKKGGKTYFITFHPAAALRFPPLRKQFTNDFATLKKILTRKPSLA